jgi:hypothetical protein
MKKTIIAVAIVALFSINAQATPSNNPCNSENDIPNCVPTPPAPPSTPGNTNTNVVQANPVNNNTTVGQVQSYNTNYNQMYQQSNTAAFGGTGGNGYGTATSTSTSTSQGGAVANSGNSTNAGNNTGTASVVVQGDQAQARDPVASAVAPTVITGNDQCLVPVALGGQAVGFGVSFGMAVRDENCEVLKLSRMVEYLTDKATALSFLRQHDKRVDDALKALGK